MCDFHLRVVQISIWPVSKFVKFDLNFEMLLEPFLVLPWCLLGAYLVLPWLRGCLGLHLGPQLKGFWDPFGAILVARGSLRGHKRYPKGPPSLCNAYVTLM